MVATFVGAALTLECPPLGIWRSGELATHISQVCRPPMVEERTLPQSFPCNCLEGC